jgi:long-chain fatty acid transport protein
MTRLSGVNVETGMVAVFPSIHFDGSASVLGLVPVPGSDGGNGGMNAIIPNFYATAEIAPNLTAGIAITAPFGNTMQYEDNWIGRYVGIKTSALSLDINPNLAFRLNDMVSVAGGVSLQYFRLDISAAIPQFLIFGPTAPDGIFNFKGDNWDFGFNLGLLAELTPATRIGLTYRSKVDHGLEGSLDFARTNPLLGLVSGPANADASLPATAVFSITHDVMPALSLSADFQWNQWSSFDALRIQSQNGPFPFILNYEDSWMASIGAQYRLGNGWTLRGGAGWDDSPVTDAYRIVGVPDADRYMLGIGAGFALSESVQIDGAYAHYFSAEHASMNTSVNNTDPIANAVVLNGRYTNHLDYVALSLRYRR